MDKIILTTPDELRAIVSEAVSGILPKQSSQPQIDTISIVREISSFRYFWCN